jgi:uncharacterized protein
VASESLELLRRTKTIALTTFRRDGTPVVTPVSVAFDGDCAFFRTWHKAWKTKRLRHTPRVEVAPSDLRGRATGPTIRARAELLSGEDARRAARALARRHRVLHAVVVPLTHRLMRYRTMHYELVADPSGGETRFADG